MGRKPVWILHAGDRYITITIIIILTIIIKKVGRGVQLFKGEDGTLKIIISGPAPGSRHVVGFNGTGGMFAC